MKLKNLAMPALRCSAATVFLALSGQAFASCTPDAYVGSVCMTAANFCPAGTVPAYGQTLPIASNTALFSLLGTTYGGDGRTTFGIPDLRGRMPVGDGQGTGLSLVIQGKQEGSEIRTLTIANMPVHNHTTTLTGSTAQEITLSSAGTGNITAEATTVVIPGAASAVDPAAGTQYYLTGVTSAANGPLTTTPPDVDPKKNATLIGTTVKVDTSTYQPKFDNVKVKATIPTSVTVGNAGGSQSFSIIPPRLALKFCVVTNGTYPPRD